MSDGAAASEAPDFEGQIEQLVALDLFPADEKKARIWYENNVAGKLQEIRNGIFASAVLNELESWDREYSKRFSLLTSIPSELAFQPKPYESVVEKLYRKSKTPKPIKFENIFHSVGDLVRMTLVSPYGDGPGFLAKKLSALGVGLDAAPAVVERADEYGYYAIHFTFETPGALLSFSTSGIEEISLTAEIQLTTQLQASLRTLTHSLYEERRLSVKSEEWRWDFESPFFRPSYIGHNLHLMESLILEMKKKSEPAK